MLERRKSAAASASASGPAASAGWRADSGKANAVIDWSRPVFCTLTGTRLHLVDRHPMIGRVATHGAGLIVARVLRPDLNDEDSGSWYTEAGEPAGIGRPITNATPMGWPRDVKVERRAPVLRHVAWPDHG
jgi:hypothetical protein